MKKARMLAAVISCLVCSLPVLAQWDTSGTNIYNTNSGNVGIGTSSPAYKLDVSGTGRFEGDVTNTGGNYIIKTSANAGFVVQNSSGVFLGALGANSTGTGSQLILGNNGYSGELLLRGGSTGANTYGDFRYIVGGSYRELALYNQDASHPVFFAGGGTVTTNPATANNVGIGTTTISNSKLSVVGIDATSSNATLSLKNSSGNSLFFVRNDGNVGIGTATPAYKLDVIGDAQITSASPASNGKLTITKSTVGSITLEAMFSQVARLTGSISTQLADYNTTYGSTFGIYGSNGIIFKNSNTDNVWNVADDAVMNIGVNGIANSRKGKIKLFGLNSGNIIVQTADAAGTWTLTLPTSAGTSGQVLSTDGAGTTSWINAPSGGSSQWTTNGNDIYYNTGNVGIGTSTPSSQLDITGFFRSTGLAGVPSTGTGVEIFYHNGGQDKSFIQSYSRTSSAFKGMDIEGSFIRLNGLSGGNVGIGTSSEPAYKLDIAGNQRILGNIGLGTAPTGNGITINAAASHVSGYAMQITGNVGGFTAIRVDNSNTGPSSGAGLLMLNNANYVGFVRMDGTNASGSATYAGQLVIQSQQSGIRYVALGATTGNPSHTFYTNYPTIEERFRVDNNGVTVSNGSMVSPLYLGGTGTTSSLVLQSTSGAGTTGANIRMLVGNNGATEAMRILNNGNILVGTTTEATNYKLAVGGNIIAEKVRVKLQSSGWPDYVFHQQYPLLPLKDVEQFIRANNHLPDVPSAKEIEQNGLDLGDGQAVLLKKIEELTLYMIEINKKVEKLEIENEQMKKQLRKN